MANASTDNGVNLMWDAIVSILRAEQNVGPTGPGSGTNPNGRLSSLWYVHESIDLWYPKLPSCGVQLDSISEKENYGQHASYITAHFQVVVAAAAEAPNDQGLFLLDDAMKKLRTLMADGKGNGIEPILRDKANFTLNGTASESGMGGWKFTWEWPEQTDLAPRAVGVCSFWACNKVMRNV